MLRLTRDSPQTPSQAFQNTLIIHLAFTGSVVIYLIVGETMRWSDPEFAGRGYGPDWFGDNLTWLRLGVLAFAAINAAPLLLIYNRDRFLDKAVARSEKDPIIALSGALLATHVLKVAIVGSIAVFGLLLYVLGSERLDLYLFCGAALVGHLLIWPRRAAWESAFRRHALTNPAIPADPWPGA